MSMRRLAFLAVLTILLCGAYGMEKPSFHTQGAPSGKPTGLLKPGEYRWKPEVSPSGPLMVLVSIPQQVMNDYANLKEQLETLLA